MYRILGTSKEEDDAANDNEASGNTEEEEKRGQGDTHLHDYDPEIFDDDDFYHQVCTHTRTHTHTVSKPVKQARCIAIVVYQRKLYAWVFLLHSIAAASRADRA